METEEKSIRLELSEICHMVYRQGMVAGSGGNISARIGDRIIITPTGWMMWQIGLESLSVMSIDATHLDGPEPSSEWQMHLRIYQTHHEVGAIIHTHSPYSVTVAITQPPSASCIPPYTAAFVKRVRRLPLLAYRPGGSVELAEQVVNALAQGPAALLESHGMVAVGKDLKSAINVAETVEEAAQLFHLSKEKGKVLSEAQIEDVLKSYKG